MTYFKLAYSGTLPAGDVWVTGFHVLSTDTIDAVHALTVTWWTTFWEGPIGGTGYKALCSAGVASVASATYQLNDNAPFRTVGTRRSINTVVGTDTANSLPQECAPLISLRSNEPGPAGRGRMYLPPSSVDTVAANGSLSTASVNAIEAAAEAAWLATNGAIFTPVVFQRGTLVRPVIVEANVPQVMAVQRRRVNKVVRTRPGFTMPGT